MFNRSFALSVALLFIVGCAPALIKTDDPIATNLEEKEFSNKVFKLMGRIESKCDSYAVRDKTIYWSCASYSRNHRPFIRDWESVASSEDLNNEFNLKSTSEWMYFIENGVVDFYAKSYEVSGANVLIAYDPSESGREMFIGNSPKIVTLMSAASGIVDTSFLSSSGISETSPSTEIQLPLVGTDSGIRETTNTGIDSKNCSDFTNQRDAIAYFRESGFDKDYDPYGLDADNNGIPCESFTRKATKTTVPSSNNCPAGKSWVTGYTRKDGRKVRGHCRARR